MIQKLFDAKSLLFTVFLENHLEHLITYLLSSIDQLSRHVFIRSSLKIVDRAKTALHRLFIAHFFAFLDIPRLCNKNRAF